MEVDLWTFEMVLETFFEGSETFALACDAVCVVYPNSDLDPGPGPFLVAFFLYHLCLTSSFAVALDFSTCPVFFARPGSHLSSVGPRPCMIDENHL